MQAGVEGPPFGVLCALQTGVYLVDLRVAELGHLSLRNVIFPDPDHVLKARSVEAQLRSMVLRRRMFPYFLFLFALHRRLITIPILRVLRSIECTIHIQNESVSVDPLPALCIVYYFYNYHRLYLCFMSSINSMCPRIIVQSVFPLSFLHSIHTKNDFLFGILTNLLFYHLVSAMSLFS